MSLDRSREPELPEVDEDRWQQPALELPVDDLYWRPPAPAGGDRNPDPDDDVGSHVIVIDLA